MEMKALINNFAVRCFRDTADQDYISARLSFRHGLYPQFYWQSLQAIEKYLKAILLFNRIKARKVNHDIELALKLTQKLPFEIDIDKTGLKFISELNQFAKFRYLETSYDVMGPRVLVLDGTIWQLRRYCKVLNYDIKLTNGSTINMLEKELELIEQTNILEPQNFKIAGGFLEKVMDDKTDPAREALVWQNMFFCNRKRKSVRLPNPFNAVNSPLFLHPEIIDEVTKYVFLPSEIVEAYRPRIED